MSLANSHKFLIRRSLEINDLPLVYFIFFFFRFEMFFFFFVFYHFSIFVCGMSYFAHSIDFTWVQNRRCQQIKSLPSRGLVRTICPTRILYVYFSSTTINICYKNITDMSIHRYFPTHCKNIRQLVKCRNVTWPWESIVCVKKKKK